MKKMWSSVWVMVFLPFSFSGVVVSLPPPFGWRCFPPLPLGFVVVFPPLPTRWRWFHPSPLLGSGVFSSSFVWVAVLFPPLPFQGGALGGVAVDLVL